ncbi:hypothetical protein MNBD_GAMMA16-2170 [hydrothermal vent metagenome]|uniref:Uncharacterized protein n=1 Tax=hydrothermal vent metagenome TaxID=652676 RepID=A0A3B0Z034_9ZZZZ
MRNKIKAVFSIGAAALILSGTAVAQIPLLGVNFGDVALGASEADCATAVGGTCVEIASGVGFVQRQIDIGGKSFIQTIISEDGFESEDFVQINFGGTGSQQGLASKLTVSEGTFAADMATDGFVAESTITAGWANEKEGIESNAVIRVDVSEAGVTDGFVAKFTVDTDFNGTTNVVNSLIADQTVILGAAGDKQVFYTEIKAADAAGTDNTGGAGVGTASWNAGDQIQVVWVGQDIDADSVSPFGAQIVSNLGTTPGSTASTSSFSSLTEEGPFGTWNAEWSNTPVFD